VKLFGNDGPEVSVSVEVPGQPAATIGDSVAGPSASLRATVTGAQATGRPGAWTLELLKQGVVAASVPFSGDAVSHAFGGLGSGRYAIRVVRQQGISELTEVYTSPLWFTSSAATPSTARGKAVKRMCRSKKKGKKRAAAKKPRRTCKKRGRRR
jgi:hypothetical protein